MHRNRLVPLLTALFLAAPAVADEREALYGTWGAPAQCAGDPIKPGGTVMASPFEVGPEWLRQGALWCRLSWGPLERRETGVFAAARAQCGEDGVNGYFVTMETKGETKGETMTIRWDFLRVNGPLDRCVGS
ncbi:MAG: hypothetical protein AAFU55_06885 [Pseudomonadota bacterium]